MPLDFQQDLFIREAESSGHHFASLIADADRALRYADEAGSMCVDSYLWEAMDALEIAEAIAPNGWARFIADELRARCHSMAMQIGFPRGVSSAREQLELLA